MKRMILSLAIVFLIAGSAAAQATGHKQAKKTAVHSKAKSTAKKSNKSKKAKATVTAKADTSNRKIYIGKDGQRATKTGHEATPVNGGYAALKKDTTSAKKKED